jgi:nucleotide-binding universal stress UspA family protein
MKLVIAIQVSDDRQVVLDPARQLAAAADAEALLLNVVNPFTDASNVVADTRREAVGAVVAERLGTLEGLAKQFDRPVQVMVEELRQGEDVPECIARVAREEQADILVIATNRAAGVRGLILGSVAQHLMRLSPCPILVVRDDEE